MSDDKSVLRLYKQKNDINVSYRVLNKEPDSGLHWHDFLEIEIIVNGTGTTVLNGIEIDIKPGSAYVLRPTDYHSIKPNGTLSLYNISIKENLLDRETLNSLALYKGGIFADLDDNELFVCSALAELMFNEYKKEKTSNKFMLNLLDNLFIVFTKNLNLTDSSDSVVPAAINDAIAYLNIHFTQNPTLKDTATAVHYNCNYFSAKFRKFMGVSFSDYLCSLKLEYSKKLLTETDLKISDIAFKSGFNSLSNFLKVFKIQNGISPLKYRQNRSK